MSAADWTAERENTLKVLWTQGLSCSQIAKQLGGVTRNAVIGKRIRLGLPDRAIPNRSYTPRPARVVAVKAPKPTQPAFKPEPIRERGAIRGPSNVRFIDRKLSQCPMFCAGEEGALGFVCGARVDAGSWCANCARIIYMPFRPMAKVKAA